MMSPTGYREPSSEIIIAPWLEELVRRYRTGPPEPIISRGIALLLLALVGVSGAFAPLLLRLYTAGYPGEPERRQALELCGRTDAFHA
jgi:hypothetical protein